MTAPRCIQAIVSKYQRTRVWRGEFVRGDSFQLGVNLNGALADGETIDTITFRILNPNSIILGDVTLGDRTASATCTAGVGDGSVVKAIATGTDGTVWTQVFVIRVYAEPWFQGETPPAMGAYSVSA